MSCVRIGTVGECPPYTPYYISQSGWADINRQRGRTYGHFNFNISIWEVNKMALLAWRLFLQTGHWKWKKWGRAWKTANFSLLFLFIKNQYIAGLLGVLNYHCVSVSHINTVRVLKLSPYTSHQGAFPARSFCCIRVICYERWGLKIKGIPEWNAEEWEMWSLN